jgi:hypothetical protein
MMTARPHYGKEFVDSVPVVSGVGGHDEPPHSETKMTDTTADDPNS